MQSKRSFFNRTLFFKNLSRFWPLWGGLSAIAALMPLYLLLELLTSNVRPDSFDMAEGLYSLVTEAAPPFIFAYAVLCAALVWSYLCFSRAVGLMHTLPVDRTCLFVTNTLSGLTMMLLPFVSVGGLTCLIALCWGFLSPLAVLHTVLAVLCLISLFYGLATFCAMLTGHLAAIPALYLLLNFLAALLENLVGILGSGFWLGVRSMETEHLLFLSPLLEIKEVFQSYHLYEEDYWPDLSGHVTWTAVVRKAELVDGHEYMLVGLDGMGAVLLYGLAGIALIVLSWLLYRRRQSERAGDVAAYVPLRPVFRFGAAVLSALSLGILLYQFFWDAFFGGRLNSLFQFVPAVICMCLGGLIGYYIASMLLEKSLRVFRGSLKGAAVICAGVLALCTVLKLDPFRMVNRIPELDEIQTLSFYTDGGDLYFTPGDSEEARQCARQVLAIHQALLDRKDELAALTWDDYNRAWRDDGPGSRVRNTSCYFEYQLKNGGTISRRYQYIVAETRIKDPDAIDGKISALLNSETVRLDRVRVPSDGTFLRLDLYGLSNAELEGPDAEYVYQALLQDAKEGNIANQYWWYGDTSDTGVPIYNTYIEVDYTIRDYGRNAVEYVRSKNVPISESMAYTLQALLDTGTISQDDIHHWQQEYDQYSYGG